ncbi:MAG: deaminase [Myxococcota bacterium]
MIIGIAGPNGAGKGEVVQYLAERSFYVHSLSDAIRDVLKQRGLEESRELMIETGRELRAANGPGALAQHLVTKLEAGKNYAIDSIRHPAEVEALRAYRAHFHLIWVDADPKIRIERLKARGRPGDPETLDQLLELEGRERGSEDPAAQQLDRVRELADYVVHNEGDLPTLHDAVQRILEKSLYFERPSWDEYFLSIAQMVATRSNCVKRKVGAVVTRERRIISTGYNGTPRGTKNCNEGGCPRCNSFARGGTQLGDCLCSHAEENAITQAAFHGVSLEGGTVYTTFSPCLQCTKMIINSGISEVVYSAEYPLGDTSLALLAEAGVVARRA